MEVLTLAECEEALRNPTVPSKDFSNILDSFIFHLQDGTNDEVDKVAQLIEGIKEPISSLFKRVDTLEKEMEKMMEKWERLKTLEDSLLIGQLAFILEEELVKKILEGTSISAKHVTITQISNALANEKDRILKLTQEQKDIIDANWNKVEREYQLDGGLYCTITALKENRNTEAHPSIENISTRLSDKVSPSDKEAVDRMLAILKNLRGHNAK